MAAAVEDRVARLEERTAALEARLASVEGRTEPARPEPARTRAAAPAAASPSPAPVPAGPLAPAPPRAAPPKRPDTGATPAAPKPSLEDLLGGRVLAYVGGLAVVVGVVLLLVIAASNGLIGEGARTAMGAATSLALLVFGVWQRERRARTDAALAATAAGVAGLFACAVVAAEVYELIPAFAGLALAFVVGATATALAVRWSAPAIGALGIVGALLAPPAVGADPEATATLLFLAVATASATAVVVARRWDWLAFAAFVVATPQWAWWLLSEDREPLAAVAVLVGFGALNVAAAAGFELRRRTPELRRSAVLLLALNTFVLAAAGWIAFDGPEGAGGAKGWLAALALAHVAAGLGALRTREGGVSRELAIIAAGLGVVLADLAFAAVAGGAVLVLGWAAGAAGFALLARHAARNTTFEDGFAGLGVGAHLALALGHALTQEAPAAALGGRSEDAPTALLALAAVAAGCFASGHLTASRHRRWRDVANAVGLATVAYATAIALDGAALTVAWALEAAALWGVAHRERDPIAARGALLLLAGALGYALVALAPPVALLDGLTDPAGAAVALAACALAAGLMALRAPEGRPDVRTGLLTTTGIVALYLASVEIVTPFGPGAGTDPQALVSGLWALVGVAALLTGLLRDVQPLRTAALALLAATVTKVFLYDLATLASLARVASFIVLGLLLLCAAFAWQRLRPRPLPDLRETPGDSG